MSTVCKRDAAEPDKSKLALGVPRVTERLSIFGSSMVSDDAHVCVFINRGPPSFTGSPARQNRLQFTTGGTQRCLKDRIAAKNETGGSMIGQAALCKYVHINGAMKWSEMLPFQIIITMFDR